MAMYVCEFCKLHCTDDDDLADHQWQEHAAAICLCGHVKAEHDGDGRDGECRRADCGCAGFRAAVDRVPARPDAVLTVAALQARLDEIGGTLHAACVSHVWSVVLTVDGAQIRAQHADLLDALRRVVIRLDEVRGD